MATNIKKLSAEDILSITQSYLEGYSFERLGVMYQMGEGTVIKVLLRGVREYIIGDFTAERLYKKMMNACVSEKSKAAIEKAFEERDDKKLDFIKYLNKLKEDLDNEFIYLNTCSREQEAEKNKSKAEIKRLTQRVNQLSKFIKRQEHS